MAEYLLIIDMDTFLVDSDEHYVTLRLFRGAENIAGLPKGRGTMCIVPLSYLCSTVESTGESMFKKLTESEITELSYKYTEEEFKINSRIGR